MFRTFMLCVIFSIAASAPVKDDSQVDEIISYENNSDGKGNYDFRFQTKSGIMRSESGMLMHEGESDEHIYVAGEYSYTDPDGKLHIIRYQADKNGFEILPPAIPSVGFSLPSQVVATLLG